MRATKLMQTTSRADENRPDGCAVCWTEADDHEVSGTATELVALVNYVTSSQLSMRDPQAHLDYCSLQLKQQLKQGLSSE
jgi:hypothetical protein